MPLNYVLHLHHLNFVALRWRYYFARLWERGQGPSKCYFWDMARWSLWTITSRPTTVKIWTPSPPSQVPCCVAEGGLGFAMVTNNPQISVVWDTKVYFSLIQNSLCKVFQGSCLPCVGSAFQSTWILRRFHINTHFHDLLGRMRTGWSRTDDKCTGPCPVHNLLVRTSHKTPSRGRLA